MKARLTEEDVKHFAHVYNFLGELKLHPKSLRLRIEMASARRQSALDALTAQLGVEQYWQKARNTMVAVIRDPKDVHRIIGRAWDYLTLDRQLEFNSTIAAQQAEMNDRAQRRFERDRRYAEAARRQPLDDATRMQRAEDRYRNEDPAVQVIADLSGADAIAADLAARQEYRDNLEAQRQRLMTQGQITSLSRNAPTKKKRKYTRKA